MTEMREYFFVAADDCRLIDFENFEGGVRLVGHCFGREGFRDNSYVKTSLIISLKDDVVVTKSGTKYHLKQMSEDYKDFIEATRNNVPVIKHWILSGSLKNGYIIHGYINGTSIVKKIVAQEGNYLVLEDKVKYFVDWKSYDDSVKREISCTDRYLDLSYKYDFEDYMGDICRPTLRFLA